MRLLSTGKDSTLYYNNFGRLRVLPKSLDFLNFLLGDLLLYSDVPYILMVFDYNQPTYEYSRTKLYYWCRDKTSRDMMLSLLETRRIMREQKRNLEIRLDETNLLLQEIGGKFY